MIEIYVIGISEYEFIKIITTTYITNPLTSEPSELFSRIKKVIYNASMPTFFTSFESAENALKEIQKNANEIKFENEIIGCNILDKKNGYKFDVEKLNIYELVPQKVS